MACHILDQNPGFATTEAAGNATSDRLGARGRRTKKKFDVASLRLILVPSRAPISF